MITTMPAANVKSRGVSKLTMPNPSPVKASDATIKHLTEIFKLMGDRSRLKILLALAHEGEMHVTSLCVMLGQSQPAVSHHLSLMRAHGLVNYRRDGKNNFYRLDSELLGDLLEQFFTDTGNSQKQIHFEEFTLTYKRR